MVNRSMTETEWGALKKALPRLKWLDEIERVRECCRNCDYLSVEQIHCKLHKIEVPREQLQQVQECFVQMIVPF